MATQVQLGLHPGLNSALAVLFFASLADYNLHRLLAVYCTHNPQQTEKLAWAAGHTIIIKVLVIGSSAGLIISLLFIKTEALFVLLPLALLSFMYSALTRFRYTGLKKLLSIPGTKTLMLTLVWASATVFVPAIQTQISVEKTQLMLVFAQRLTFIFAIAIPFDIRDMEADSQAGIPSIPAALGIKTALRLCNLSLFLSAMLTFMQYLGYGFTFTLPAYLISVTLILFLINNKKLKSLPFYYHGMLDGSIVIHGLLIALSFYLQALL